MIVTYQPEQIEAIWPFVEDLVQRALDRGSVYTKKDIKDGLQDARLQLWTWHTDKIETVLITSIYDKTCLLLALAGKNIKDWIPCIELVEKWAKDIGCTEMRIQGRKGWSRLLNYQLAGRDELNLHIMGKKL